MKYLVDTHCLLWSLFSPKKLSDRARSTLLDPNNDIAVSAVTFWEISLKASLGKLELKGTSSDELPRLAESMGFECLPLDAASAASFHQLPRDAHRDPFDRMLVWQAINMRMPFITKDSDLKQYVKQGLMLHW